MSLLVKGGEGGSFTPHPAYVGPTVCCDVQDLGWEESPKWGWKYKIALVFFCGEYIEREVDGVKKRVPLTVRKKFTATMSEKGNLRAFCKSWRGGVDFDKETVKNGFDFERMLGAEGLIQVSQYTGNDGNTYAGVDTIMKLPKGTQGIAYPNEYVRLKDRPDWTGPAKHPAMSEPDAGEGPSPHKTDDDDDLPF